MWSFVYIYSLKVHFLPSTMSPDLTVWAQITQPNKTTNCSKYKLKVKKFQTYGQIMTTDCSQIET